MTKRIISIIAFLVAVTGSFYVGYISNDTVETPIVEDDPDINPDGETTITDEVFLEVLDKLMENHYSRPTKALLMEGAINGMFDILDDPHSTYFDYEEYQNFQGGFEESYVGIGVTVSFVNEQIIVEAVKDDGPADNEGILPNDIIVSVDNEMIVGENRFDTIDRILGEEGTNVTIGIKRTGVENIIQLEMTRAVIENSTVKFTSFDQGGKTIGYIEVTTFGDETFEKFQEAIETLELMNIDGMIVDLRNNGGGHLSTVYYMMNEFLINNGKEMFSAEFYSGGEFSTEKYYASNTTRKPYTIVTLVNSNSASASEVFASGMQEQGDYPIIGTKTYGKGTMQTDLRVTATVGDRLNISIGKWITADGNWVHFNGGTDGVTPDIEVNPTVYETAYKVFLIDEDPFVYDTVDPRIQNIQYILNAMGYDVREDGYFDTTTLQAVLTIQNENGLSATGELNEETLLVINEALDDYQDNPMYDTILQTAMDYLINE